MGNLAGGGGGGGLLGGLMGGGGSSGGGGFLGNLLGGLPDPLGIGKMLGITGQEKPEMGAGGPPPGPQQPSGVQFNGGPPGSGVSFNPSQMLNSPMGPTGFGVGSGGRRQ
jgi:hypothetical protein